MGGGEYNVNDKKPPESEKNCFIRKKTNGGINGGKWAFVICLVWRKIAFVSIRPFNFMSESIW